MVSIRSARAKKLAGRMSVLLVILLAVLCGQPAAVFSCATCGCSELCPLTMMEQGETGASGKDLLSDSIWGTIILKIAYQRDAQMQKLLRHRRVVNSLTTGGVTGAIGGTFSQNVISMATLNPPAGQFDSYLPGSLGLGMSGLVNVVLDGSLLINWRFSEKIRARQLVIKGQVEAILNHLEHSQAACPQAQSELASIIGDRAAGECIKLWQSSHATTALAKDRTLSQGESHVDSGNIDSLGSPKMIDGTAMAKH